MKRRVDRSDAFYTDVNQAMDYGFESFGNRATELFYKSLDDWIELISEYPMVGADSETLSGSRRVRVMSYWLYYTIFEESVLLLRLIRTERDTF